MECSGVPQGMGSKHACIGAGIGAEIYPKFCKLHKSLEFSKLFYFLCAFL